ncbi:RHS repeat-associated core domain-containing protein, partial [Aliidiomarina haloalkalitolerans]
MAFLYPSGSNNRGLPERLVVESVYQNGFLKGYRNHSTGVMIEQVTQVNAHGNGTRVQFQNGAETLYSYQSSTGWLTGMTVYHSGVIRNIDYQYDLNGNLTSRQQTFRQGTGSDVNESFYYDNLYRLTQYTQETRGDWGGGGDEPCPPDMVCTGPVPDPGDPPPKEIQSLHGNSSYTTSSSTNMVAHYTYDGYGNLLSKGDVGFNGASYTYAGGAPESRPTRLLSVSSSHGTQTFTYDGNGNVINDGLQSFTYTTFDKPIEVRRAADFRTLFRYGPKRELVYQQDIRPTGTQTRWLFGGYERSVQENGDIEHRFMVGGTVVTHTEHGSGTTEQVTHLHKDAQGSTVVITGNAVLGNVLKQQIAYDPWGKQATLWSHNQFVFGLRLGKMRGYTGHTMVNDLNLIHMGGRTYNPVLGRFMQADPFIQAGANLQNYNRYSYVLNNPLSYTDPSGYLFKKLNTKFGRFTPLLAMAVMIIPGAQPIGATMLKGF